MNSIDIREGDVLVYEGSQYPIKFVGEWEGMALTRSMRRLMTHTCQTMRNPAVLNGKRGAAVLNLDNVTCMPLDPVSEEIRSRLGLETPHEIKQTFVAVGGLYVQIIVEDLKR